MMMRDRFKHEDDSPWENPEVQLKLKKIKDQTLEKILIIPDEISFIEPDFFAQLHSLKLYDDYDATINIEMKNRFAGYLNCITQESNYYGDLYQKFNNFLDDGLENIEQEGSRLESFDVERSRFNAEIRYYLDKLLIQIMK